MPIRANRKNSRREFNTKMRYLLEYMNAAMEVDAKSEKGQINAQKTKDFNTFEVEHLRLEGLYNTAHDAAVDALEAVKDLLFLIEKHAVSDFVNLSKTIIKEGTKSVHEYVADEAMNQYVSEFASGVKEVTRQKAYSKRHENTADYSALVEPLTQMKALLEAALEKIAPNYFALAYFLKFGEGELPAVDTAELNVFLRQYLDEHFMLSFIEDAKLAVEYSFERSNQAKEKVIEAITEKRPQFEACTMKKKEALKEAKELSKLVEDAKDRLSTKKESITYTFELALKRAVETYYKAEPNNKKEMKKFNRETKKYERIIARGKTPDYKVTPPKIIDEAIAKENMLHRLDLIVDAYREDLKNAGSFDVEVETIKLIDHFKEQAQRVAHVVTKSLAKTRALKLMKEVGIPNPRQRYRQFPFEFSGGMRQRIVIAIALSANPDILICDEPTTALDVTIQSQILELINRIKKERNLSVIFITHDLGVVANMADRIAVMYAGKIVEMGTSEDIFYDPRHPYTWALLSSMPDLDTKEKLDAIPGTPPNMIYPPKGDAFAPRNKYAMAIDFELEPPMFEISPTHKAATWLLHEMAPKIEPPKAIQERIERMKKKAKGGAQ